MKLRSTLSLFACAALAATFAGCGSSDSPEEASQAPAVSKPEAAGPDAAFRAIFDAMRDGDAAAFAEHSTAHFLEDFLPIEEFGRAAQEFRDAGISFTLGEVREEGDTAVVGVTLRDGDGEKGTLEGVAKRIDGVWKVDEMRAPGAERMQVANNGKQIVIAIVAANIDRAANMRGEVWPNKGKYQDSNAYFAKLMGDGGKAILTGLSLSTFAGGGVDPAADMTEFKTKGNAWNMLAGIANCADARTPFIWTRNLRLTQADLEAYARNPDAERSLADRLDPSVEPFGDEGVTVISKGAEMFWIPAAKLTTRTFFGGVELDPSAVEIVEALPD